MDEYDIVIVGGGGAGLTAAIYAARAQRRTAVFERGVTGGQIATTDAVENFPGFPEGINGFDLAQKMQEQAKRFGAEIIADEIVSLDRDAHGGFVLATSGARYHARAVILTAGADYNKLGVAGEDEFVGRGVSYCATCDAAFFKGDAVVVVGGGDAALDEGEFVTRYADSVTIVHRRDSLRGAALLQERAFANPKIRFKWDTVVEAIEGGDHVERVVLRNVKTGEITTMATAAVFIFIGQTPNSGLLSGLVETDRGGHAIVDLQMRTSVPGLFVAGDVRTQSVRQLISATGDGATAAIAADHWLASVNEQH